MKVYGIRRCVALLALVLPLLGQPVLVHRGTLNSASLAPFGLPNGGIARGSIFTVFGTSLGPSTPATVFAFPLGTDLAGVTMSVVQGDVTTAAIPLYVSAGQINAILPSTVKPGLASLRVTYQGKRSNAIPIQVVDASPGLYAVSSGGWGPGVVQNFITLINEPVNSMTTPAVRLQTVIIWGTGLGPVTFPDNVAPTVGPVGTVTVTIGGRPAIVEYAGRTPCCSGVDQIVVQVPNDAPLGCWVPVQVKSGGVVSNTVTMAIAARGATSCSDPSNPVSELVKSAGTQGVVSVQRVTGNNPRIFGSDPYQLDYFYARFVNRPVSGFSFDPYWSYPPVGACLVHEASGDASIGKSLRGSASAATIDPRIRPVLRDGQLTIDSFGSSSTLDNLTVGGTVANKTVDAGLLSGNATVTIPSAGTAAVVSIGSSGSAGPPVWAQRDSLGLLDRAQGLTLTFTPSDPAVATPILLNSYAAFADATVQVQCLAGPGQSTFTIPADVMANLPPTYRLVDGSYAVLAIGTLPVSGVGRFSTSEVSNGAVLFSQWVSKVVEIQ